MMYVLVLGHARAHTRIRAEPLGVNACWDPRHFHSSALWPVGDGRLDFIGRKNGETDQTNGQNDWIKTRSERINGGWWRISEDGIEKDGAAENEREEEKKNSRVRTSKDYVSWNHNWSPRDGNLCALFFSTDTTPGHSAHHICQILHVWCVVRPYLCLARMVDAITRYAIRPFGAVRAHCQ